MESVILKIIDEANNMDFEIPIQSDSGSPLSIDKSLSDLTNLTKRTGVSTVSFQVDITKELAQAYDHFNSSQHHNYKDVDADKDAAIIIDGNEYERGKVRIVNSKNHNDLEKAKLIFIGNNFAWTEAMKGITTADLTWVNNSFIYIPENIKATFDNTVDDGDEYVFPLENRGGRKMSNQVHTEDFRPSLFFHSFLTRAFLKIGYTFTGGITTSINFKKLVLEFWGERFRKLQSVIIVNHFQFSSYYDPGIGPQLSRYSEFFVANVPALSTDWINKFPMNSGNNSVEFTWDDSLNPNYDTWSLFDENGGTISPSGNRAGKFTATEQGSYTYDLSFKRKWWGLDFTINSPYNTDFVINVFIKKYNSFGVLLDTYNFDGSILYLIDLDSSSTYGQSLHSNIDASGKATFSMEEDDYVEIWTTFYGSVFTDLRGFTLQFHNVICKCKLNKEILEGQTFDLPDVLDDKVKVLDILNDFSRVFNIFWDTDVLLKEVKIETRDDFYSDISEAKDFTSRVNLLKPIITNYNSVSHKREMVFSYAKDSADKFVSERDKEMSTTLAEYSHSLPNKFKLGTTKIACNVLAASYYLKDIESVSNADAALAPYTARLWNEFTPTSPNEMIINNNPRLLNYNYTIQNGDGSKLGGAYANRFRFYDEATDRVKIPYVLPHQIQEAGNTVAEAAYNLYWHAHHGQDGLFANYWSKTVTEIINGTNVTCYLLFDAKQWVDFKFSDVIYFDSPIKLKGYWLVEKIQNYQPERSTVTKVKLLKRIEYDVQVEGTTLIEETTIIGSAEKTTSGTTTASLDGTTSSLEMTVEITDGDGNTVSVPLYTENLDGSTTTTKI